MASSPMISVLALDPGAVHVGLALFEAQNSACPMKVSDWELSRVWELQPITLEIYLDDALEDGWVTEGVCEDFNLVGVLYEMQRNPQATRRSRDVNLTIECIGAVKAYFRRHQIPLSMQNPSIQKNAKDWMDRQQIGLQSVRQRQGAHAKSAELHGWWHIRQKYRLRGVTL